MCTDLQFHTRPVRKHLMFSCLCNLDMSLVGAHTPSNCSVSLPHSPPHSPYTLYFLIIAHHFLTLLLQDLMNIARTTLSSKLLTQHKDHFASLAVKAILRLKGSGNLEAIQLIKKLGGAMNDSYLEEGVGVCGWVGGCGGVGVGGCGGGWMGECT